jgi:tight adherence protein C
MRGAGAFCLAVVCWFGVPNSIAGLAFPLFLMLLAGGAGVVGWLLPGFAANWSATHRAAAIVAGLPDALELLVICAEGGLGLGEGIDKIVEELQHSQPELADELAWTAADLKILPSQDQALSRFAARIDVPIVQSVVAALGQTMRYGTPFAKAVRIMAAEIRSDSLIRLEERANSLPTFMTIPMILFILPTILLIVCGPAALHLWDVLHSR